MSQSKNKYTTIFRKARRNKKTKRKKGGAAPLPKVPEDAEIFRLYEEIENLKFQFEDDEDFTDLHLSYPKTIGAYTDMSEKPGTITQQRNIRRGNYPLNPVYKKMARIHEQIREHFEEDKPRIIEKLIVKNNKILEDLMTEREKKRRKVLIAQLKTNAMQAIVDSHNERMKTSGTKKRKRKRKGKEKGKGKGKGKGKNKTKRKK